MILDTSAVVAIVMKEPGYEELLLNDGQRQSGHRHRDPDRDGYRALRAAGKATRDPCCLACCPKPR